MNLMFNLSYYVYYIMTLISFRNCASITLKQGNTCLVNCEQRLCKLTQIPTVLVKSRYGVKVMTFDSKV